MKIYERMSEETKEKLRAAHPRKEELSEQDVLELMGVSRNTYKKVKGRVRQQ